MHFRLEEILLFWFIIVSITIHHNQLTDCLFSSAVLHEDDVLAADYNDFLVANSNLQMDEIEDRGNSAKNTLPVNFENSPSDSSSVGDDNQKSHQQQQTQEHHLPPSTNSNEPHTVETLTTSKENTADFINDSPSVKFAENRYDTLYGTLQQHHGHMPPTYGGQRHQTPEKLLYTKEIKMKQGRLKGIIRNMHPQTGLRDVDQYLGLPYAEAPVGSRRFMPAGAPLPWQGLKIARHLPPVCPQQIPDIALNGNGKMSKGRYEQLIRLLPYLKVENEDCLYLNVYVPREDGLEQTHQYPVIVYIHGESFSWNSGNPYDGSVLASYGQVIVVTVNYRLGVLGFMKPGIYENTVSNFGLLDQIAALHWIKENIASFGGDKNSVTLMGHSTGAACVNYLMVSPVASGLFHRAILMSGSAMADWAASNHSLQLTMQIAHGLNCPLNDDNEEMLSCMRRKRYQDILKIPTSFPQFSTSLGPIVDGHVIPNQPYKVMGQYTELFSRYDLLFGITEVESYHTLVASALEEGLRENERDNLLRFYMQSRFEIRPDLALAATLKKYKDMYNNPIKASNLEHRDAVLDILSDARVVGPLIQTGLFHADVNPRNYMYVFGHNSAAGAYATLPRSITGEELAFIFGAPLAAAGPFHNKYSAQEKLLSEAVMSYWSNFAKTGNPKAPWKGTFINLHALEWDRYDLDWPEFNKRNQCYINIGIPPSIGYKYRQIYMNFWNKELPDEINQIAAIQQQPFMHAYPMGPTQQVPRGGTSVYPSEIITGHISKFSSQLGRASHVTDDPLRTLQHLLKESHKSMPETAENMYNAPPTFGIVHQAEHDGEADGDPVPGNPQITTVPYQASSEPADTSSESEKEVAKSESTIQLLTGLIVLFLILNVIIYSTFIIQKKKKTTHVSRKLGILSYDGTTDDDLKRSKQTDGDDSYILDMVRKSNTYEAVKTSHSPINGFKITRQLSSSTVDTHTKVCEWISHEGNMRGGNRKNNGSNDSPKGSKKTATTKASPTFSMRGQSFLKRPRKVSVAIDATPQARSNSVLKQEPIEVTKLKTTDGSRNRIICQEIEVDAALLTAQDSIDSSCYSLMDQDSLQIKFATDSTDSGAATNLKIDHKHSRSDPVEMYYTVHKSDEKVTSFITPSPSDGSQHRSPVDDINVTSRDDNNVSSPLTPEQQIYAIKRRNFPKVLPNYPYESFGSGGGSSSGAVAGSRTSNNSTFKRNSLPPNSFMPNQMGKVPPAPPMRTISTLGRRPSTTSSRRQSHCITTSPVMLAQDYTEEDEPEITQNTLIVGPIIPKSLESNYSTVHKPKDSKHRSDDDEILPAVKKEQHKANITSSSEHSSDEIPMKTAGCPSGMVQPPLPTSLLAGTFPRFESKSPADISLPKLAHHTEATYTIQPPPTDLTPRLAAAAIGSSSCGGSTVGIPRIAIKQNSPLKAAQPGPAVTNAAMNKSNIPRVHQQAASLGQAITTGSGMTMTMMSPPSSQYCSPPAAPSTTEIFALDQHHLQQQQQQPHHQHHGISRIPQLKTNLNYFQPATSGASAAIPIDSTSSSLSAGSLQLLQSPSSSTSLSSTSSTSSSDATISSTGTVRTEPKHK